MEPSKVNSTSVARLAWMLIAVFGIVALSLATYFGMAARTARDQPNEQRRSPVIKATAPATATNTKRQQSSPIDGKLKANPPAALTQPAHALTPMEIVNYAEGGLENTGLLEEMTREWESDWDRDFGPAPNLETASNQTSVKG